MLGKLMKYEFKHTSRTMFTTYAVLAVSTFMGTLALRRLAQGDDSAATFLSIIYGIMCVFYVISIVVIYCVDFIYLCQYYYKTMYSAQGYLTHTLPIAPAAAFSVKILVFFIWMLLSSVLSVLSVLILLSVASSGRFFEMFASVSWDSFTASVENTFGMSAGFLIFLWIVEIFLGVLKMILWVTASMAIGQLSQKSRAGFSILAGVSLYMAGQIADTLFLGVSGYSTRLLIDGKLKSFVNTIIGGDIVLTVIFLIVLYGICVFINHKKLNLE